MTTAPPSRRWWRIALSALATLALLVGLAYFALLRAYPPQRLAALLAERVQSVTGREFRIAGGLSFQLLPTIAVVASDVSLANAPWGSRSEMATVRRVAFEVAVMPLLQGQLHVLRIDVDGADVLLETSARGQANWVFAEREGGRPTASEPVAVQPVQLDSLKLLDSRLTYRSGITETTHAMTVESLRIVGDGERNTLSARLAGPQRAWRLDGTTGRFDALVQGQTEWPFDLQLQAEGARLSARGTLGTGGALQAAVTARLDNAAALAPLLPDAAVLPMPIEASAQVQRSAAAISADKVRLSLAGQTIDGRIRVRTEAGKPQAELDLTAGTIDLARWGVPAVRQAAASAPQARTPIFSDNPLPTLALPTLPIVARARIERLEAPGLPALSGLSAQIRTTPERLLVEPLTLSLAGGTLQGRLDLTARHGQALRANLRADGERLSMQALDASGGSTRMRGGRADLRVSLDANGRSPHELAASANGNVRLSVTDAVVQGGAVMERNILVALLRAVLPGQKGDSQLRIECAVANLALKDGVAAIDRSVAMETDRLAMAASGELDLRTQTVKLVFHPVAKKGLGLDSATLAKLVRLEGPLHDPQIGMDVAGTALEAATIGAAVATAGLTIVGKRLLRGEDETQVCKRALGPARP